MVGFWISRICGLMISRLFGLAGDCEFVDVVGVTGIVVSELPSVPTERENRGIS